MNTEAPVLIFGGTGGVGFALARLLVDRGRAVYLVGRRIDRVQECGRALGGVASSVCDVLDPAAIAATVAEAVADRPLAGLAYCVGSIVLKPFKRTTANDFLDAYRLNVIGAALAVQAAEQALRSGNGAVLLFSTVAAASGFPNHTVIAAAKGAVEALTRSLAADLAPEVRVNCIAPSLTRTPLSAPLTANEAMAKSIAALHPIPRLGEPEDMARAAAFLLGDEAGWITGQVLAVDGGRGSVRSKG